MQLPWDAIQANTIAFSKKRKNAHNEEAEAQAFQIDFLHVFGVDDPIGVGSFEYKVPLSGNKTGYIDYLWKGRIAIEMKSRGKDLTAAFEQLRTYMTHLPEDLRRMPEIMKRIAACKNDRENALDIGRRKLA